MMENNEVQQIGFDQLENALVPNSSFSDAPNYKTAIANIKSYQLKGAPKYFAGTVGDIKNANKNANKLGNYFSQEEVKELSEWFTNHPKYYQDNDKVILFLGCACPNAKLKTDAEKKVMCLANNGLANALIVPETDCDGAIGDYLNAVFGHVGNICGVDDKTNPRFLISGHSQHKMLFKIPWKQEWGRSLPKQMDVNGFNTLHDNIKQQSQAINQNFQGSDSITNQNSGPNSQNITLTCVNNDTNGMNNSNMVLNPIQISKNRTVGQLKEQILQTNNNNQANILPTNQVKNDDFVVCTVNAQGEPVDILDDKTTISNAFGNDTKYVVLPKVIGIKIPVNGNEMVINYPIINDNNQFNQETFGDYIKRFLTNKGYINIQIQSDDMWLKENGWKVASGYVDCFDICPVHITVTAAKKNPVVQASNQVNTTNIIPNNQNVATEAMINVFFDFDNKPCCVTINTNATVSDLVQAVKKKVKNNNITITHNSQKLQEDDERTLLQVSIFNSTKLIVTQAKQVQNQPVNQNGVVNQNHYNFNNIGQQFSANRQIIMPNVVKQVPVPVQTITPTSNLTTSPQHLNYQTRIASIPFYPRRCYNATLKNQQKTKVGDITRPNAKYINKNNYQYHAPFFPSQVVRMKNNIQPSVQPTDQAIFGGYNPFVPSKYPVPVQTPTQIVNNGAVPVQSVLTVPNIVQTVPVQAPNFVQTVPVTVPINQTVVPIQQTTNSITPYTQYEANGICDPQRKYRMFDGCGFLYSKKPIKTWQSQRGLQMWTDDPGAEYCFQ